MHSAAACQKNNHLPAHKFCDKWAAHAKPHPAEFWGSPTPEITTQVGNLQCTQQQCIQQLHVRSRKKNTCPHTNFVTSGLPTQNRIPAESWGSPTPKITTHLVLRTLGTTDRCYFCLRSTSKKLHVVSPVYQIGCGPILQVSTPVVILAGC